MKKGIIKILLAFLLFMTMTINVNAASRSDKSSKTPIDIQGKTFYAGVLVKLNNDQDERRTAFIGDIDINYDSSKNMINASVKRSKINEIFEETDTSMYFNIDLNIDYHDFSNDEFMVRGVADTGIYWYEADGTRVSPEKNYLEFISTAVEIWGGNYIATSVSELYLYKGDFFLDSSRSIIDDYSLSDFDDCMVEVYLSKINFNFTIEEDVKADFKNVQEVVRNNGTEESLGITPPENLTIENVYKIYDNRNTNATFVQMFDKEGNSIVLEDDLKIEVDSSENIDTFVQRFEDDNSEKIQVLSFTYSKFFEGDANIKVYVGDKFNVGDSLTLYYYNPEIDNMEKIEEIVYVDDNKYVSFQLHHFSDYILVKNDNNLKIIDDDNSSETQTPNLFGIAAITISIIMVIVTIIFIIILKNKKTKKDY